MAIHLGLGSWADPEYAGLIYPRGFPPDMRLSAYAMWFDRIEVNATYYSTPRREAVVKWVEATPPVFQFDIRLHRMFSISPEKTAKVGRMLPYLLEATEPLFAAKKFGAFLLVLSPIFAPSRHRLEELDPLIEAIKPHPLVIELRHADWVKGKARAETLAWFRDRKVTWVAVDMPPLEGSDLMPIVDVVTNPQLAYLRLHGRNLEYLEGKTAAEKHTYLYDETELSELAERIRKLATKAKTVHVSANNHANDFAPRTALALKEMLGQFD